jgi:hypothetical protein
MLAGKAHSECSEYVKEAIRIIGPPCRMILAGLGLIDGGAAIDVPGIHYLYGGKCALIKRPIRVKRPIRGV